MGKYSLDLDKYATIARQAAAEGCVLLRNDNMALPIKMGDSVAVFGRTAFRYYKSGLGSGGLVNTRYVVGILDALKERKEIELKESLLKVYEEWIEEHPYDEGQGWGKVPWSQEEMPVTDDVIAAAGYADVAIVMIGRTAGEDQDNSATPGSYLLTDVEKEMIYKVSKAFPRTVVVLNVGNIIDMKWVDECNPAAVLYVWQGGQEGGNGVVDVLMGDVNPCGKLTDTIARDITDYPSTENFGDRVRNFYTEDIYVGYRYFETFAKEKVLYPFGYGLSYTNFNIQSSLKEVREDEIVVEATVTNIGEYPGKEVVQVYIGAPQGVLGKPERVLAAFAKTKVLETGESQKIILTIPKYYFASYDDSGITGHRYAYVLEAGVYEIFVGSDVRNADSCGNYAEKFKVVEQLEEACAPTLAFSRIKPKRAGIGRVTDTFTEQLFLEISDNFFEVNYEEVPVRTINPYERLKKRRMQEIAYTGDKGYKLVDVLDQKVTMDEFVAQLSDDDLIHMFRGEGMCSPRVTPGTAAAFGGVTERLNEFGIPAACCADGPSGIRMDCGTKAFSLPNGTLLGCTFDVELVESLYQMLGKELRKNKIDSILGPGMNIHRNPLNGRNFEYCSEDPLLTGKISMAQILGMEYSGVTGTMKHFCANNQEVARNDSDSVVSERALREIYLRGFEIAVKEGKARSIMTTYGSLNGIWTAGNYDLNTTILRNEWGYDGIVMTDWWAQGNKEGESPSRSRRAPMVAAQNDIYMVNPDSDGDEGQDDLHEMLAKGEITRSDLQRNAKNILQFILHVPAILHANNRIDAEELAEMNAQEEGEISIADLKFFYQDKETKNIVIPGNEFVAKRGSSSIVGIELDELGEFDIELTLKSDLGSLAQLPITISLDNIIKHVVSFQGTEGKEIVESRPMGYINGKHHYLKLYFGADGTMVEKVVLAFRQ